MRKFWITAVAVGMLGFLPAVASAGGYDRGARYSGGYGSHGGGSHWGGSKSFFDISIGFGGGSRGSGYYSRFGYSNYDNYCGPRYSYPVYTPRVYCPPPVVYAPTVVYPSTVVYSAPAVCAPPVVYTPAPVYYQTPVRYYGSARYYYGR